MPLFSKHFMLGMIAVGGFAIGLVVGSFVTWNFVQPNDSSVIKVKDIFEQQGLKENMEVLQNEEGDLEEDGEMEYVLFEKQEYAVLSRYAFDESDPTREVLHVCRPSVVTGVYVGVFETDEFTPPQNLTCAFDSAEKLVLVENGTLKLLDVITTNGVSREAILKDIRLINEQSLLIAFESDACDLFALCIDMFDRLFLIDLASGTVIHAFEGVGTIVDLEMVDFNPDLTKYVTLLGCPEGCPDAIIEGYDLIKKEKKSFANVIVRGGDYEWGADVQTDRRVEENYWIDNNTFHLVVRRHTGDQTEVKELDLTF